MPIMDGLESSRQIRAFEKLSGKYDRTTIIAVTGVAQADVQRDAVSSGMDFFMTKPIILNSLGPVIKDYIDANRDPMQG